MSKKHDDGYALAFVLVVLTVICLVVASVLPASLRNLNSQQASIEQMQDKYAAQGEIEKELARIVAELKAGTLAIPQEGVVLSIDGTTLNISIVKEHESVTVSCEAKIENIGTSDGSTVYKCGDPKIQYVSYEVTIAEGGDGDV